MESFKYAVRRRNVTMAQVERQSAAVHLRCKTGMRPESLELRAKEKMVMVPAVVERFLAEPITSQEQELLLNIHQCERKHSHGAIQTDLQAPFRNRAQQHFGV